MLSLPAFLKAFDAGANGLEKCLQLGIEARQDLKRISIGVLKLLRRCFVSKGEMLVCGSLRLRHQLLGTLFGIDKHLLAAILRHPKNV